MKVLIICFIAVAYLVTPGKSVCCRAGLKSIGVTGGPRWVAPTGSFMCHDCTNPTPCCAHGKCNVFCCNCDGGCRGGCRVSRALGGWTRLFADDGAPGSAHDVVKDGDMDGDGRLSFAEAHHYVTKRSAYDTDTAQRMLMDMDMDSDNFFSPEEIDS